MTKIKNRADLVHFIKRADRMVKVYDWEDKITHPYPNVPMRVSQILDECRDFDNCTDGTQEYLICLADGLRERMEAWERYELAPKITVRVKKSGKLLVIVKDDLDMFEDLVEVV